MNILCIFFLFFLVPADKFWYTNQGQAEEIENVDDREVFRETLDAFKLLGTIYIMFNFNHLNCSELDLNQIRL